MLLVPAIVSLALKHLARVERSSMSSACGLCGAWCALQVISLHIQSLTPLHSLAYLLTNTRRSTCMSRLAWCMSTVVVAV